MKNFVACASFLGVLVLANVVAAGVFAVLGPLALELQDDEYKIGAMVVVMVLAVACAILFLKGCLREIVDQLQCRSGRRGG